MFKILVIYMYIAPGADNHLVSNVYQKYKSSVNLLICCKFITFNYFVTVFHIQI